VSVPYIGFGNDQLRDQTECREGDMIECPHCHHQHPVDFGEDIDTGEKSNLLGFYNCGDKMYLAAVAGRFVTGIKPCCSGTIDTEEPRDT